MCGRDILAPLLDGTLDIVDADRDWLRGRLEAWHPAAVPPLLAPHWRPGEPPIMKLWWPDLGDELAKAGLAGDALADWKVAADLVQALDHPLEKLAEAVQFVRRAVMGLREAGTRRGGRQAVVAERLASALAHAFACIDVMDDAYGLRERASAWARELARGAPVVPAAP